MSRLFNPDEELAQPRKPKGKPATWLLSVQQDNGAKAFFTLKGPHAKVIEERAAIMRGSDAFVSCWLILKEPARLY